MINEKMNEIKDVIKSLIHEFGHRKDFKQAIGAEFISRNLSAYRAMNVFMGNESLDTISNTEDNAKFLFIFSVALNRAIQESGTDHFSIPVKEYFTILEYNKWRNYREEDVSESVFPLIFDDVTKLTDNIWQTTISAKRLYSLDSNNVFVYNFLTQRNPKVTSAGVQIDFDKRKSMEIKDLMLKGRLHPTHIKINVLKTFDEQIHYDDRRKTLTIGESSVINTFDGHHRKVANSLAIEENSELDFTWGLIITNLSEDAARDYMVQINKQKPIRREQIVQWDLDRKENQVVSVISDSRISKLNKIMVDQRSEVKNRRGLTTKNVIADAIKENYDLDDATDIRALGNWIVEFTDYLLGLSVEENGDSLIGNENMFYGYIALSAKVIGNPDWKHTVKNKMESIDFGKSNPIWREIGMLKKRVPNKSTREKLYSLFTSKEVQHNVFSGQQY